MEVVASAQVVLQALREDLETAWVPDPLGGYDFEALIEH